MLARCVGSTPSSPLPRHSPMSFDVVSSNQSGVLKHNTLTLGMFYQGGGHGQGRSTTLNFNLYNNTRHEPPAGRWLPLPPPPSAINVSILMRALKPWLQLLHTYNDKKGAAISLFNHMKHSFHVFWSLCYCLN